MAPSNDQLICHLCGLPIAKGEGDSRGKSSREHVPPKQFYPKSIREGGKLNLWTIPAHDRCNADYREDEEYFYHNVYPLVCDGNGAMAAVVLQDIRRRVAQPQSRVLLRDILRRCKNETPAGLILPPNMIRLSVAENRIQRVAIKIAQGVFFREHQRYMPRVNCKDIRLCESPADAPEMYRISWQLSEERSVCREVFAYRIASDKGRHWLSLLFWESFMFCIIFDQ